MSLTYKTKTATQMEIFAHLESCSEDFIPPLKERVGLLDYSKKIFDKSITFEAWKNGILVGLVSAYFNDTMTRGGYITSISTSRECRGMGIGLALLTGCIEYAEAKNFKEINLEVSRNNTFATQLYEKTGFQVLEARNETLLMRLQISSRNYEN